MTGVHHRESVHSGMHKDYSEKLLVLDHLEKQVTGVDELVKNLTNKTGYLEEQVRSLMTIIDSLKCEKLQLDTVIKILIMP